MRLLLIAFVGCLAGSGTLFGLVPGITSIQNPASNILPGQPNYGIAEGSIFVIYGSGMGPTSIVIAQTLPYGTTLSGTSVKVTANGGVYNAPIIYTLNTQVVAVMPSSVPVGNATVQVTYSGFNSAAFPTTIVQNNFGVSTLNETGTGPAVMTYPIPTAPFYAVVGSTNSAIPGNTYTLWGTGLGPSAGGNSDTNINVFATVGPQVQITVGGLQVPSGSISYYGRSPGAGPGLDQINFTIPQGVSGCNVSLVIQTIGTPSTLSNNTTIPIMPGGGPCSDPVAVPASTWPPLLALSGGANISLFQMNQLSTTTYLNNTPTTKVSAQASASFVHYTQAQLASQYTSIFSPAVSLGSCAVTVNLGPGTAGAANYTVLDAGPNLTLNSFTGQAYPLGKQGTGFYQTSGVVAFPAGNYTITNGTGGSGVGPIGSVALTVPTFASWSNQSAVANAAITRANGLTLTWAAGSATTGYIDIMGSSGFGSANNYSVNFECTAPTSAGTFTIPAATLMALPVGAGTLSLSNAAGVLLSVPGMNLAAAIGSYTTSVTLNWN